MLRDSGEITTIVFDVDGVLIDNSTPWHRDLDQDFGFSAEQLQKIFFDIHWKDIVVGRAGIESRLAGCLANLSTSVDVEQFLAYWFSKSASVDSQLFSEIEILRIRGFILHCATNQEHRRADFIWNNLAFSEKFGALHYSAELGVSKPNIEFFNRVAERIQLETSKLLLVDDRSENVEAARSAGWHALLWRRGVNLLSELSRSPTTFYRSGV